MAVRPAVKNAKERHELRRRSFNRIAELYDEARPTYPEQLIEDALRLSAIPPAGRILEIGPGTGQATLPFARRGYSMLCLELGERLAKILTRKTRSYAKVEVRNTAFENWPVEPGAFDMVLSATAFHWIPARIGFSRAADALKPGGSLALIWNFRETPDNELYRELAGIYDRCAPKLDNPAPPEQRIRRQEKKIVSSGWFECR